MIYKKSLALVKNVTFALVAVCLVASCQEEEVVAPVADVATEATAVLESNISSITITGENTIFEQSVECSTCTYVVAKNTDTIDGHALGLKAGSVICLDKALQYGNLSFINLVGTVENPIVIGNCNGQ